MLHFKIKPFFWYLQLAESESPHKSLTPPSDSVSAPTHMHSIKNRRLVRGLKLASFFLIISLGSAIAALTSGVILLWDKSLLGFLPFAISLAASATCFVIYFIFSSSSRCQLCKSTTLRSLKCHRSNQATKLLGSYRLKVSTSILLRNHFRCPYCGERFDCRPKVSTPPATVERQGQPQRIRKRPQLPERSHAVKKASP